VAINPAISSANLANKAAQVGFAQNITAPKELKQTEEPRRVQHQDEEGLEQSSARGGDRGKSLEQTPEPRNQNLDLIRRDPGGRRQVQTGTTKAGVQTGKAGEATPESKSTQLQTPQAQTSDAATRTLRLALADNSRHLQARFDATQPQQGTQQPSMGAEARRAVMLRNLENMVNMQLAQYTGNEPYSRSNYRQILGALTQMQGGGTSTKTQGSSVDSRDDQTWLAGEESEVKDGIYRLYSGQAAKTLSFFETPDDKKSGGDPLDLVA
jgi:hypothetical protein